MTTPLEKILQITHNTQTGPNQWDAKCPCRDDDDHPSLRISQGRQGQVLLKCQRGGGCDINQICDSLKIKMTDLFPPATKPNLTLTDTYTYLNEDNTTSFQVLRYTDENGKKTFKQRRPGPNGTWDWTTSDLQKPLYRLPQILKAKQNGETIYIVEGEKDVHTLEKLGKTATTNAGGASSDTNTKWQPHHTQTLAGCNIIIIADNDEPGHNHARNVAKQLRTANCNVKTYTPTTHKDITEIVQHTENTNQKITDHLTPLETPLTQLIDTLQTTNPTDTQKINHALQTYKNTTNPTPPTQNPIKTTLWTTLLDTPINTTYDWIIPNLLEKQDRVIVVAAEGAGKTTLSKQIALMTAAGIHPFRHTPIKPAVTLTIDLENPERIIHRTTQKLYQSIQKHTNTKNINAHLLLKPDGLNLLNPHDQQQLEQHIQNIQPDLILLGPLYKAYTDPGTKTAEAVTTEIAKYLDHIRTTYNCALWLEHHAPLGNQGHRELRPFGSAVWSRWSEYGIALTPDPTDPNTIQLKHYRGQREPRDWPETCTRGTTWPFEPQTYTQYTP